MRVLIAGGGTAGHVFPAIALADELSRRGTTVEFVGSPQGQEASLVPAAGYRFHATGADQMPRKVSVAALRSAWVALRSVRACRSIVRAADVVVGVGGYASVPAVLAARRARRPVVLHEQNAVPGLANRVASRWARAVALTFEDSAARLPHARRVVVTGLPVRSQILAVTSSREALAKEAAAELNLDPARRTIVVFGGSQGALHLDRVAVHAARLLATEGAQLLILTGPAHLDEVEREAAASRFPIRAIGFLERIELAYAIADLVVARAGSSVAELAVCGIPSILVPYPFATEHHQEANARELARRGAALVVDDAALTPSSFAERVSSLLADGDRRDRMSAAALAWSKPDAAERLASLVEESA